MIPGFGSSSYLDAYLQPKYFWDISPHEDLTLAPYISTNHGLIMNGTYRRYFERGYLTTQGSIMRDQDDDETAATYMSNPVTNSMIIGFPIWI